MCGDYSKMSVRHRLKQLVPRDGRCWPAPTHITRDLLLKGFTLFLVCLLMLQYVINVFVTNKYPLNRVRVPTSPPDFRPNSSRNASALEPGVSRGSSVLTDHVYGFVPVQVTATADVHPADKHSSLHRVTHTGHLSPELPPELPPVPPLTVQKTSRRKKPVTLVEVSHTDIPAEVPLEVTMSMEDIEVPPSLLNDTQKNTSSPFCPRSPPNLGRYNIH